MLSKIFPLPKFEFRTEQLQRKEIRTSLYHYWIWLFTVRIHSIGKVCFEWIEIRYGVGIFVYGSLISKIKIISKCSNFWTMLFNFFFRSFVWLNCSTQFFILHFLDDIVNFSILTEIKYSEKTKFPKFFNFVVLKLK